MEVHGVPCLKLASILQGGDPSDIFLLKSAKQQLDKIDEPYAYVATIGKAGQEAGLFRVAKACIIGVYKANFSKTTQSEDGSAEVQIVD